MPPRPAGAHLENEVVAVRGVLNRTSVAAGCTRHVRCVVQEDNRGPEVGALADNLEPAIWEEGVDLPDVRPADRID